MLVDFAGYDVVSNRYLEPIIDSGMTCSYQLILP